MRILIPRRMVDTKRWDELVRTSPDGWVFALSCWLDMVQSVPQWGAEDLSFLVEENGRALAAVPLHRLAGGNTLASSGWGYTAPALAQDLAPVRQARLLAEIYEQIRDKIPFGGFGNVEDVANTAVFLCSPAARWITGQVLAVDGGQSLPA